MTPIVEYPLNEFVVNIPATLYFTVGVIAATVILILIGYALGRNSKGLPFQVETPKKPKEVNQKDEKGKPVGDVFNDLMREKDDEHRTPTIM